MNPAGPASSCWAGLQVCLHPAAHLRWVTEVGEIGVEVAVPATCTSCRSRRRPGTGRLASGFWLWARRTGRFRPRSCGCAGCDRSRRRSSRRRSSSCTPPANAAGRTARRRPGFDGCRDPERTACRRATPPSRWRAGSRLAKIKPLYDSTRGGETRPDAGRIESVVAAVGFDVKRHAHQFAGVAVGPGVIGAAEEGGVAGLGPADLHAPVAALVEQHPHRPGCRRGPR